MKDFLSWVEGHTERKESEQYFSMYQTCLLFNSIRNVLADNGTISVDELLGKTKVNNEKLSLSDFANKQQFDAYMKELRERGELESET